MVVRKLVAAAVVLLSVGISAGARSAPTDTCSLGSRYPIRSVSSYSTDENEGYTAYRRFRGAEIVVPAQPGLTSEWLQRVVMQQVATGACDFGVPNTQVTVLSAGDAFWVRLSGPNEYTAGIILKHAQQLTR
jgi:hypothetical protein